MARKNITAQASSEHQEPDFQELLDELSKCRLSEQNALQEASLFRQTVGQLSIVSITDLSGAIIDCNEMFTQISGYSRDELLGQDHRVINSGYHPKSFWVKMWRTIAAGDIWKGEVCNRAKDGSIYWVDTIIAPFTNSSGSITKFVSIRTDITERKLAEERLQSSEFQLNEAQRLARIGSWSLQIQENKLEWSDTIYDIFELSKDSFEPTYEAFLGFVHPDDREIVDAAYTDSLAGKTSYEITHRLLMPDGRIKHVHERCENKYSDNGDPLCSLGTVQDVTHIKQTEMELRAARKQADAANNAKSEFLANMSHEIRTPLTAIIGFANIIDSDNEYQVDHNFIQEAMHAISKNAHHLLSIINDILDMTKLEAGKMQIEQIETSLPDILRDAAALMDLRAMEKGLSLRVELAPNLPDLIQSDPTRLSQIILNLISNAIKFTEQGTITVVAQFDDPTATLVVRVIDTGIGMSQDKTREVLRFDAFSQGDRSMARRFGGTGLGLKISSTLAELMGGTIDARSEPGSGSEFILRLPSVSVMDTSPSPTSTGPVDTQTQNKPRESQPTHPAIAPLHAKRILVAEDGPDNQRIISFILSRAGAEITLVENGRLALERAIQSQKAGQLYDCVLMDMQMPEMDGYEATRQIREQNINIPVIALTAHAMAGDREKCLDAGCDDYLTKPIRKDLLIETCQRWINLQSAQECAAR